MTGSRHTRLYGSVLAAGLTLSLTLGSFFAEGAATERILAMADIHGDFDSALAMLQHVGLVDASGRWVPGNHTFIQTGDFTDRGPRVRSVLDLLMSLERDAPPGQVVVLLGNHEFMNISGELTDVTEADYSSFRDPLSEGRQRAAFAEYVTFMDHRARRLDLPVPKWTAGGKNRWMEQHPLGFVEQREAFSPEGIYGAWLRGLPVVVKKDDTLFLHAGIHPAIAELSLEEINLRVRTEIRTFDQIKRYLIDESLALPFFTLKELQVFAREELDFQASAISLRQRQAEEIGKSYRIPPSLDQHIQILKTVVEMGSWLSFHRNGVLWFRGFSEWSDREGTSRIDGLLGTYEARQIVVGHTTSPGRIRTRFGNRLFLIDTGMLSSVYRGGRASVLEIHDGLFRAIYLDKETILTN